MQKSSRYNTIHGGISLILLTFIILSLVSFAALSIVSARADARLTEKYKEQMQNYYSAHNQAQLFLHALCEDGIAQDPEITRRFPCGEHLELVVTAVREADGFYRLVSEKTESTVIYDYDSTLPVIK